MKCVRSLPSTETAQEGARTATQSVEGSRARAEDLQGRRGSSMAVKDTVRIRESRSPQTAQALSSPPRLYLHDHGSTSLATEQETNATKNHQPTAFAAVIVSAL